jgi:hypothetical protein
MRASGGGGAGVETTRAVMTTLLSAGQLAL